MNAIFNTASPLPTVLDRPFEPGPHRRQSVNGYALRSDEVDRFNSTLAQLGRTQPIDRDQLAAAARELCGTSVYDAAAPAIRQRMRRLAVLDRMLADRQWTPANDAVDTSRLIVDYARGHDDLIPDWVPQVGRLDDAIVLETAWPQVGDEASEYLDYCRLRAIEAHLAGRAVIGYRFDRRDWQQARIAEHALQAHQRAVREASFLPIAPMLFRVH